MKPQEGRKLGPERAQGKLIDKGHPHCVSEQEMNVYSFAYLFILSFIHSETTNIELLHARHYSKGFINVNSFNTQNNIALILQIRKLSHKQAK